MSFFFFAYAASSASSAPSPTPQQLLPPWWFYLKPSQRSGRDSLNNCSKCCLFCSYLFFPFYWHIIRIPIQLVNIPAYLNGGVTWKAGIAQKGDITVSIYDNTDHALRPVNITLRDSLGFLAVQKLAAVKDISKMENEQLLCELREIISDLHDSYMYCPEHKDWTWGLCIWRYSNTYLFWTNDYPDWSRSRFGLILCEFRRKTNRDHKIAASFPQRIPI